MMDLFSVFGFLFSAELSLINQPQTISTNRKQKTEN